MLYAAQAYLVCREFQIGDEVVVVHEETVGRRHILKEVPGRILEKYPHHLVIGTGEGRQVQESFCYADILGSGRPVRKKG